MRKPKWAGPHISSNRENSIELTSMLQSTRPTTDAEFERVVEHLVSASGVLEALRSMGDLSQAAKSVPPSRAIQVLRPLIANHGADPLPAYLGLFAIAGVESIEPDEVLVDAVASGDRGLSEHAAWGLSRRRPIASAVPHLMGLVDHGGFTQMMAELALETWLDEMPDIIWQAGRDVPERFLHMPQRTPRSRRSRPQVGGLRIAQVLVQGRVDAALSAPASGDGGGLITLQVGLTSELARNDAVSEVYLVSRRIEDGSGLFDTESQEIAPGGILARLAFGGSDYLPMAEMWSHRTELERELRDLLIKEGPFDALHLRFADVGTFAGARVAEELGIPLLFTLAPDPHAVIASGELAGSITREDFAGVDLQQHYVFRTWLVAWMLERADRLALLPRVDQRRQFKALLGVDIDDSDRFRVIAEGVDTALSTEARRVVLAAPESDLPPVIDELRNLVDELPSARRGLPLILSVGRLNRVKGMDRVVAAWAGDERIRSEYNLLIVGGDLEKPSAEERSSLEAIFRATGENPSGLVMMGGRSHTDVAILMAATADGVEAVAGVGGVYASGSEKEEFGLAIVEALAAGLPVIAPSIGGPATYVEHGFTGFLTDTTDIERIRDGIRWASDVRLSEVRADAARRMVRSRYSLAAMAEQLVELYGETRQRRSSAS